MAKKALIAIVAILMILVSLFIGILLGRSTPKAKAVESGELQKPESIEDRFSYSYGYLLAQSSQYYGKLDFGYVAKGVEDYASSSPYFTLEEMNAALAEYQQNMVRENEENTKEVREQNRKAADDFLARNKTQDGVITTDSGLQYKVLSASSGNGMRPDMSSTVYVSYQLTLLDGTVADSSYDRGKPTVFTLGNVIPGFAEGVSYMKEGDKFRLWVHPDLGYGDRDIPGIAPGSLLIFDVELVRVEKQAQ